MAVHTSLQSTRSPEGMSSSKIERRRSKPPGRAEQGARTGASTAKMPAVRRKPGLEAKAAAMWPRQGPLGRGSAGRCPSASGASAASRQAGFRSLRANGSVRSEAQVRRQRSRSGGYRAQPLQVFKLHLYLSCLPGILCLLLGGQNGRSRSVLFGRSRTAKMAGQPRRSFFQNEALRCTV